MARKAQTERITMGTGNVFRDLGFKGAEEMRVKADLVIAISRAMRAKKLTQTKLAETIGMDQPAVSKLLRGHTEGYSADRLMKILTVLGQDVEITVRPNERSRTKTGRVLVVKQPTVTPHAADARNVRESKVRYAPKKKKKGAG